MAFTLTATIKPETEIDVTVDLDDVIRLLNEIPFAARMNYISKILNEVKMDHADISESHQTIIVSYLERTLELMKNL